MVVILALVAAVVLLAVGWVLDNDVLVMAAGALAVVVLVGLVAERALTSRRPSWLAGRDRDAEESPAEGTRTAAAVDAPEVTDGAAAEPGPDSGEPEEPGEPEAPVGAVDAFAPVVFVPGRTTFHRADCASVRDKAVSRALRSDLEAGGMKACRTCLGRGSA